MFKDGESFENWLDEAKIPRTKRSPHQLAVLQAAYAFLQQVGTDYASRRIVGHFLLNCQLGLKLSQIARLVNETRPTASRQNNLSSRQVIREIQHRLTGRPYGKLLPRYAGPIAQFLVTHPEASRDDVLDFIERTWNIRVGFTALHNFLNKYGLDRKSLHEGVPPEPAHPATDERSLLQVLDQPPVSGLPVPCPPNDFFLAKPNMLVRSCSSPRCCNGGGPHKSASPMTTGHCNVAS